MEHGKKNNKHTFNMRVWKNVSPGGTKPKEIDGNSYCNMMGHENGMMGYVWIRSTSDMRIYPNKGLTSVGKGERPRDPHLVDWDGNGNFGNWNDEDAQWGNRENCKFFRPSNFDAATQHCLDARSGEIERPIPWEKFSASMEITLGTCTCDNTALDWPADPIIEALPIIAQLAAYTYDEAEDPAGVFDFWLSPCGGTDLVADDLKKAFDITQGVADGVTGFQKPKNFDKGNGKKGDKGNPDRSPTTSMNGDDQMTTTATTTTTNECEPGKRANPTRSGMTAVMPGVCNNSEQTTHAYAITSLSYGPTPTQVQATCTVAGPRPAFNTVPRFEKTPRGPPLRALLKQQPIPENDIMRRQPQHRVGNTMAKAGNTSNTARNSYPNIRQSVRWLPKSQNGGAGSMWSGRSFMAVIFEWMTDAELYRRASNPQMNFGLNQVTVCGTYTELNVGITVDHRPEFTIASWEHELDADADDGLRKNPCWPRKITQDDPGFTLLNYDKYYDRNPYPSYDYTKAYVDGSNGSPPINRDWELMGESYYNTVNATWSSTARRVAPSRFCIQIVIPIQFIFFCAI
ncbi:Fc.00g103780.m01.CDS01 [Cosmosporella sp. VM-42]